MVEMVIADTGVGIGRQGSRARGLGVIGMRERAQSLNGTFTIEESASGGTRIHVAIPLPADGRTQPQALAG